MNVKIDLEKARKIFGNINFTDENLTKKKYRELAKKYHTDNVGDNKKIAEINDAYNEVKKFQNSHKNKTISSTFESRMNENMNFTTKEEIEKYIKNIRVELFSLRILLRNSFETLKNYEEKIIDLEKKLKFNIWYLLFYNKDFNQIIKNFIFLLLGFEIVISLILILAFDLSIAKFIVTNGCLLGLFCVIISFIFPITLTKANLLTSYITEKENSILVIKTFKSRIELLENLEKMLLNKLAELS